MFYALDLRDGFIGVGSSGKGAVAVPLPEVSTFLNRSHQWQEILRHLRKICAAIGTLHRYRYVESGDVLAGRVHNAHDHLSGGLIVMPSLDYCTNGWGSSQG